MVVMNVVMAEVWSMFVVYMTKNVEVLTEMLHSTRKYCSLSGMDGDLLLHNLLGLLLTVCKYRKMPQLMAISKRAVVIIAGHKGEPIKCFDCGGVRQGRREKYDGEAKRLEAQQNLLSKLLATPEEAYARRAEAHDRWRLDWGGRCCRRCSVHHVAQSS